MAHANDRLPQGYTNKTRRVGRTVEKVYEGRDAAARLRREAECLRRIVSVLPVPAVSDIDEPHRRLCMTWIDGTPGQQLMRSGSPQPVLTAAGSLLRQLQSDGSSVLAPVLSGHGTIAVHGDFGPQNLLLDARGQIVALVDWEFAHMGDAVEDLAWAEWIVRMHHPDAIDALEELFTAYGARPSWQARHEAMVVHCERLRYRCHTEGLLEAEEAWRRRLNATERWVA